MSGVSVSTIKSPEFINITSISPLISKCEIKVLYIGQNRNRSFISKEVARDMASTLPGTPIVGYYSEDKEDFRDHGEQMIWDGDGIKFNCLTKPYGFVPLDTKVWFKEFQDTDEFGNTTLREYLMCEGYLWTEQYEEAKKVISEGRPHSMELDEKTLKGHWAEDTNRGIDFYIINDAIFSKLCILGEDVEPCFEGSSVTAPDVSSTFSLKFEDVSKSLFTMMKELKEFTSSLQNDKGGSSMDDMNTNVQIQESSEAPITENSLENQDNLNQEVPAENENTVEENFAKKDEEEKEDTDKEEKSDEEDKGEPDKEDDDEEDDDKKKPSKSSLEDLEQKVETLTAEYTALQEKYTALEQEKEVLAQFKAKVENEEKDALIAKFYMLSDEDKKDVIANKAKYTLEEIEAKLAVICCRKKVSFADDSAEENNAATNVYTYNLNGVSVDSNLPAYLQAVKNHRNANI